MHTFAFKYIYIYIVVSMFGVLVRIGVNSGVCVVEYMILDDDMN